MYKICDNADNLEECTSLISLKGGRQMCCTLFI